MTKFFCKKSGGYKKKDAGGKVFETLLEGSRDKGPWYESNSYSKSKIEKWLKAGIIEMV